MIKLKNRMVRWVVTFAILSTSSVFAQSGVASGLYQIVSGTFTECCSLLGENRYSLPNESQTFVSLANDPQSGLPAMTFLSRDMQTVFGVSLCPTGAANFSFGDGMVFPDRIVFHVDPGGPYQLSWNYTATNSPDGLQIDGTLGALRMLCADSYDRFSHTNVVAVLMPSPTIRVSEVEICWNTSSNRTYQTQYRSSLTTNNWTDLGPPQVGNGSTNCITDKVVLEQPRRFYRVLVVP